MFMHGKRDKNHIQIVHYFEERGCEVFCSADLGGGFPDLVVSYNDHTFLVEIKTETGELTEAQERFFLRWLAAVHVVRNQNQVNLLVDYYQAKRG